MFEVDRLFVRTMGGIKLNLKLAKYSERGAKIKDKNNMCKSDRSCQSDRSTCLNDKSWDEAEMISILVYNILV